MNLFRWLWKRLTGKRGSQQESRPAVLSDQEVVAIRDQVPFRFYIDASHFPEDLKKATGLDKWKKVRDDQN